METDLLLYHKYYDSSSKKESKFVLMFVTSDWVTYDVLLLTVHSD